MPRVVEPVETTGSGWSSPSRPRDPGGRARRDHRTRLVEPVETTGRGWSSPSRPPAATGPARRDHGTRVVEPVETEPGGRARRDHHMVNLDKLDHPGLAQSCPAGARRAGLTFTAAIQTGSSPGFRANAPAED